VWRGRPMSRLRNDLARRLRARGAARERQQGDIASAFDGHAEPALVARANSGHAPRQNLAALLDEGLEHFDFLVVDEIHFLDTEAADLLLAKILPFASAWAGRSAARTGRATLPGPSRRTGRAGYWLLLTHVLISTFS